MKHNENDGKYIKYLIFYSYSQMAMIVPPKPEGLRGMWIK